MIKMLPYYVLYVATLRMDVMGIVILMRILTDAIEEVSTFVIDKTSKTGIK